MRRRLFATLGVFFALTLALYLPSVRRRAKEARLERARVFAETPKKEVLEQRLLDLGCSSVVVVPLEESLARPISAGHKPHWWVQCPGPVQWAEVAAQSKSLVGGALIETDTFIVQLGEDGELSQPPVPIIRGEHPHVRRDALSRVSAFLRAYVGW